MNKKNTGAETLSGRFLFYILTHFKPIWRFIAATPWLNLKVNALLINKAIAATKPRPYAFSLWDNYTSWKSLTDRTFSSRHISEAPDVYTQSLPSVGDVSELFERGAFDRLSDKSTVLFAYFAQWFTDGFLQTNKQDWKKNHSNHDIDLSDLYGLNEHVTNIIRLKEGGLLKSQMLPDGEYPPYYYDENGVTKPEFHCLPILERSDVSEAHKRMFFAMGGERANIQIGFVAMNTLFLREHNRLCRILQANNPTWDDERLFQTARCILTVILIKIVIEEYIPHISPLLFTFVADPTPFKKVNWYRTNWMAVEFTLLYRWHGLIPSTYRIGNQELPASDALFNNQLLLDHGLGAWIDAASHQPAGDIGPFNTHSTIMEAEKASIALGRQAKLRTYNEYRKEFSFLPVTSFDQISGDPKVQEKLEQLYVHVDKIELYAGLFAEDRSPGGILGPLMGAMVSVDAFSQALTNPLLAPEVFNDTTFTKEGMKIIQETRSLQDVVNRNVPGGPYLSRFTQVGYDG